MKRYYIYIMTNKSKTLYTGFTNNLERRVCEHKNRINSDFTSKYNITKLLYYEVALNADAGIVREKQIKGWLRIKKIALIESVNPQWKDLASDWYDV
ncbi:MAG: GIY-YIG nuclease family protein [Ignavibacteriales bacterium]|nr:GIY-YIG nuclease family protein [Ignavibacteriales bacterium]